MFSRTPERRQMLYERVVTRPQVKKFEDVILAVESWERDLQLYEAAGGELPKDEQRRTVLMNMLPSDTTRTALFDYQKFGTYDEVLNEIRTQTQFLLERNIVGKPVHIAEADNAGQEEPEPTEG